MNDRLQDRDFLLCEEAPPQQCIECDVLLPDSETFPLMMINETGEAVVCNGPVVLCTRCRNAYAQESFFSRVAMQFQFNPYLLVGFIDLEQIPEDKRHLPLGEDPDLPVPLVEFASFKAMRPASFEDEVAQA